MATEIVIFPLREGKKTDDTNNAVRQGLKDLFDTLKDQNGFQRAYHGREIENPNTFRLFVDWDSPEAHEEFTKKEYDHSTSFNSDYTNDEIVITNHLWID